MSDQPGCSCSICEDSYTVSDNYLRDRIAAALKTANDRAAGFIEWDELADAVIAELESMLREAGYTERLNDD